MKTLLLKYWDRLRSSFWFVPAAMVCLGICAVVLGPLVTSGSTWPGSIPVVPPTRVLSEVTEIGGVG